VSIALEFLDVIVPIARIRDSYPGGWEQCLHDYSARIGERVWYDRHLFRDGALSPAEVRRLVEGWEVIGFEPIGTRRGGVRVGLYWKDVCVVNWRQGGPTRPCEWLVFDQSSRTAHLAGAEAGPLAWRGRPRAGARR